MSPSVLAQTLNPPAIAARSWLLVDTVSGQTLAARDINKRVDPAGMAQLMTAYLVFGAIGEGRLDINKLATISDHAWKAAKSGPKMFLEPKVPVKVQDLLYGLVIQSGNDAAVALAELVSGEETAFVAMMNREAVRMGLKDTHFKSAAGLPHKEQYSTVKDLSLLAMNLIRDYPDSYKIYSLREFTYNRVRQRNRNRLLWLDTTVDGITATSGAGEYSLIASAKRESATGERRMLAIIADANSEQTQTQEGLKLLNWGFGNFNTIKLYNRRQAIAHLNVTSGSRRTLPIGFDFDAYVSVPKGGIPRLKSILERQEPLIAPIGEKDRVGTLKMMLDGKMLLELPVIALEPVGVASILDRVWDNVRAWFK
ncbi:MAG: D-alanyl-D-alanine carboxypeptidase [Burkholderiaceae bacterium]|nr:D-alanyl-D-alanine carboxypeptidase [Burkholderiaceae bacterium]